MYSIISYQLLKEDKIELIVTMGTYGMKEIRLNMEVIPEIHSIYCLKYLFFLNISKQLVKILKEITSFNNFNTFVGHLL